MQIRSSIAAAGLFALAACGSTELEPGEWEMKMEMLNVTAPGLPPAILAQMKQPAKVTRDCMTAEEAKGPKSDMFTRGMGGNCKQESFTWSGGRISGVTSCTGGAGGGKMTMTMDGQYGAQTMEIAIKTAAEAQGVALNMDMRMTGRRVGECPAGKAG